MKKWQSVVLRWLVIPGVLVVLLELGALALGGLLGMTGIVSPETWDSYNRHFHPLLGGGPLNGKSWEDYDPWYGHRKDDFGNDMRSQLEFTNKDWGTVRVFVLGGSTVHGAGGGPHETIPKWLAKELNEIEGYGLESRRFEVLNGGVSGYYSPMELSFLQNELAHYKPDLVVVMDGYNDLSNTLGLGGSKGHPSRYHWSNHQRALHREMTSGWPRVVLPPEWTPENCLYSVNLVGRFS